MDILSYERSLESCIVCKHVLLTGLSGLGGDFLLHGVAVGALASLESLCVCRERCDGSVSDLSGKSLEIRGCGDKVGLAAKADDDSLVAFCADKYGAFGSLAVSPLGSDELTLLTDDAYSLLEVAFSLDESLLAIHHTGRRHLTKFHYVFSSDFHIRYF